MGNSNAIQFSMGFDLSQLQTGAARAQAMTARVMGRIGASSSLAMGAAAAATISVFKKIEETVKLAAEKVSGVFDMGREFTKLSERTGIATGRLSMMQRGLKMSDVEVEKLAPALTRMQVMLGAAANGSKLASGALSNLGLTVEDLKKLSPDQQFLTIAKAIAAIEDPSARATAAAGMFGRLMGGELMPLFRNAAALDMMGGKLDAQAEVFQKNAESFDKAAKKLDRVGKQFNGFWVGLSSSVVGSVLKALDQMQGGNFVEKGQQLGNVLSPVILAFMKIPAVIDFVEAGLATIAVYGLLLGESLMNGAERFYDGLKAAFLYALAYSTDLIASLLDLPAKLCIGLASGLEWAFQNAIAFFGNAMWDMIANVQAGFQFAIQTAVSKALSILPASLKKFLGIEDFQADTFASLQSDAKKGYAGKKTTAEDFATISARNEKRVRDASPFLTEMVASLRTVADTFQQDAAKAWGQATGDKTNTQLEQTILKLENFALGKVDEGKKIWNQENGGGAESDKKPKEKPKYQWTTDIMKREWMSGGHGFVRTGAEAARYQREKREARKNAKKPDKKATAEGTNERLDELIKKQDEYFG